MRLKLTYVFLIISLIASFQSCNEDEEFTNPYSGGKKPLGVKFNALVQPDPGEGPEQSVVTFAINGLKQYPKDEITFLFNGVPAEILEVSETSVKVKIPANASTGYTSVLVQDQIFIGPKFKVLGKIDFDPDLLVTTGSNRAINDYYKLSDGRFILVGAFSDYDKKGTIVPLNGIVRIREEGYLDNTFRPNGGSKGSILSIAVSGAKLFVGGSISGYLFNPGGQNIMPYINNITRLQEDGSLDSIKVNTWSTTNAYTGTGPGTGKQKAVPSFNGGTTSSIRKIYNYQDKIIAIGDFKYYVSRRYNEPTSPYVVGGVIYKADSVILDSIEAPQLIKFNLDGSLDKTYRFDSQSNKGKPSGNGTIMTSYLHTDGNLLLAGNFTKFDEADAPRIIRLKPDGTRDASFSVGSGANKVISSVYYNETTRKYLVAGSFTNFNGVSALGMVMLKEDGTVDNSFSSKGFENGDPNFIKQLSNGLIVVGGLFDIYNGIRRPGLLILQPDGNLAPGYNTLGELKGTLTQVVESKNSAGKTSILLLGNFSQLNGTNVSNLTRLVLEP